MRPDFDSLDDMLVSQAGPATPGMAARKCRHQWGIVNERTPDGDVVYVDECVRCGKPHSLSAARRGRNSRKRGGAAELDVARTLGASKVGPLGHPWDVERPGWCRLQVKKLARYPSLTQVTEWIDAIPAGREMRGVALIQPGRGGRRLIVLDLDEFAEHHGEPT
jgi:hypothetical protein